MKRWHGTVLTVIFIITVIFVIAIPIVLSNCNLISSIWFEVIYDISIGLSTSIFLFYLIDYVIEKHNRQEEKKKLKIAILKIKPSIDKFYSFFIDLYAGTLEKAIDEGSPVLNSIFSQKEELYQSIIENVNPEEDSPYLDLDRTRFPDPSNIFSISAPYLTWEKAWMNQYMSFYQDLRYFQENYGFLLTSDLLQKTEDLLKTVGDVLRMMKYKEMANIDLRNIENKTKETFYKIINLKKNNDFV